jgi:hypothetical protein
MLQEIRKMRFEEVYFGWRGRIRVAVGMLVTKHPPHRSQRADFPHWAPASGNDAEAL